MTVEGSIQEEQVHDYDPEDIQGLPDYQMVGGIAEYNTQYESDVREIIENAAEDGTRLSITAFDEENGVAIDFFDRGMSADYMLEQMDSMNMSIAEYLAYESNGLLDAENIGFFQVHESGESSDLAF